MSSLVPYFNLMHDSGNSLHTNTRAHMHLKLDLYTYNIVSWDMYMSLLPPLYIASCALAYSQSQVKQRA